MDQAEGDATFASCSVGTMCLTTSYMSRVRLSHTKNPTLISHQRCQGPDANVKETEKLTAEIANTASILILCTERYRAACACQMFTCRVFYHAPRQNLHRFKLTSCSHNSLSPSTKSRRLMYTKVGSEQFFGSACGAISTKVISQLWILHGSLDHWNAQQSAILRFAHRSSFVQLSKPHCPMLLSCKCTRL